MLDSKLHPAIVGCSDGNCGMYSPHMATVRPATTVRNYNTFKDTKTMAQCQVLVGLFFDFYSIFSVQMNEMNSVNKRLKLFGISTFILYLAVSK